MSQTVYPPQPFVVQSGNVTPGHAAVWTTNGVIQDGGGAGNGLLSGLGILGTGTTFTIQSAKSDLANTQLGFGVDSTGLATISVTSFNGAPAGSLQYVINGVTYAFPGPGNGDVVGPAGATSGNIPSFNGTSGTVLKDSGTSIAEIPPAVATIADLRSATDTSLAQSQSMVLNYASIGDQGGGIFQVDPTDTSSADNGGTIIVDASGRRWHRLFDGPINVRWFGAKGSPAVDTTAVQDAITAAEAVGAEIYAPAGTYIVSGLTVTSANMAIRGDGKYATTFENDSATASTLTFSAGFGTVEGIGFSSSVTRSSGSFVDFGTQGNMLLKDFYMSGYWIGLTFSGPITQADDGVFENGVASAAGTGGTGGISVGDAGSGTAQRISNVIMSAASGADPAFGIRVFQTGDLKIDNSNIIQHGVDLYVVPGSGQVVSSLWGNNTFFDSANSGISMVGSGSIVRTRFTSCWTGSHANNGVLIGNGSATVESVHFVDHQSVLNASGSGIAVFGGATDVSILGGLFAGNTDGIYIDANVNDFTIDGASAGAYGGVSGNSGYGIIVTTGTSDRYIVTNNRVHGNTTGSVADGGTGSSKYVANNIV